MATGREQRIAARKRNLFQQKQQVNRLYAQRLAEGMTPAQAATTPYAPATQQVVTDADTIESIAQRNGVDPTNVLDANPELRQLRTGMVVNVPAPGSPEWRAQNISGGIGLPSNAALGSTTNNLQGTNYWNSEKLTPAQANPFAPNTSAAFGNNQGGALPPAFQSTPPQPQGGGFFANLAQQFRNYNPNQYATPAQQFALSSTTPASASPTPQTPQPQLPRPARPASSLPTTYPGGFRRWLDEEMGQINTPGYTPNSATLKMLENLKLIEKSTPPAYTYSGGGRRRKGGGGGKGPRVPTPRVPGMAPAPQERLPAFGSGAGGFGLINWRI